MTGDQRSSAIIGVVGPLVIARDAELTAVVRMLAGVVEHGPAGLVLWGEAGIGKSTIWRAGVDAARSGAFA